MKFLAFAFFILVAGAVFAGCTGSAWHYLPAVSGSSGILVNVTMQLVPGTGDIYFSIYPEVGIATQDSARDAVAYAFSFAGENRSACDVVLKAYLPEGESGYIDGPSGGAALTLMGIAALEGKGLRGDSIITGTITNRGLIGSVGGLYEKGKIAADRGLKYFLTPPQTLYERILLQMLQEDANISVMEVRNISDAGAFLIDRKNITIVRTPPSVEPVNESLPAYNANPAFRDVAIAMMDIFNRSAASIDPRITEEQMLGPYFEQSAGNERALLQKGYYFSAANDAFVNYLDTETIANVGTLDVQSRLDASERCLQATTLPQITDANFEWVAGAELRKGWAAKKMSEVRAGNATLKEEKYAQYHNAMYADAWCGIAGILAKGAPQGGEAFNESALEGLSMEYINEAAQAQSTDSDIIWHFENARKLYQEGKYAGSIIDSVFVIEMANATGAFTDNEDAALSELSRLKNQRRDSLWGNAYASHAAYVLSGGDEQTAYTLFKYAEGLDAAVVRMREAVLASGVRQYASEIKCKGELAQAKLVLAGIGAIAVLALAAALYLYLRKLRKPNKNPTLLNQEKAEKPWRTRKS